MRFQALLTKIRHLLSVTWHVSNQSLRFASALSELSKREPHRMRLSSSKAALQALHEGLVLARDLFASYVYQFILEFPLNLSFFILVTLVYDPQLTVETRRWPMSLVESMVTGEVVVRAKMAHLWKYEVEVSLFWFQLYSPVHTLYHLPLAEPARLFLGIYCSAWWCASRQLLPMAPFITEYCFPCSIPLHLHRIVV